MLIPTVISERDTGFILRSAIGRDIAQIAQIIRGGAHSAVGRAGDKEYLTSWVTHHTDPGVIADRISDPFGVTVVSTDMAGKVIGTGYLRRDGYIGSIYCAVQGVGLGRLILGSLLEIACANGIPRQTMNIHTQNDRMIGLSVKMGFGFHSLDMDNTFGDGGQFAIYERPAR